MTTWSCRQSYLGIDAEKREAYQRVLQVIGVRDIEHLVWLQIFDSLADICKAQSEYLQILAVADHRLEIPGRVRSIVVDSVEVKTL